MGLRYPKEMIDGLMREVGTMEDSVTYQAIIEQGKALGKSIGESAGRLAGEKRVLLLAGERLWGPADPRTQAALDAIQDLGRVEEMALRLKTAQGWQDLLKPPASRRSKRSRG